MTARRKDQHVIFDGFFTAETYKGHRQGGDDKAPSPPSRQHHGAALRRDIEAAVRNGATRAGLYLTFTSFPGVEVLAATFQLKPTKKRPALDVLALARNIVAGQPVESVTVFVPHGAESEFFKRLDRYVLATPPKLKARRYWNQFDRVASVQLATLSALWTDLPEHFPNGGQSIWWEVWLRRSDGEELARLTAFANKHGLGLSGRALQLGDRVICNLHATSAQLSLSFAEFFDLAELRRSPTIATPILNAGAATHGEWINDILRRTKFAAANAATVCVLDSGVMRAHPLLAPALPAERWLSVDNEWGADDHHLHGGHGTPMAGLALYGDLAELLLPTEDVVLEHGLESVKILHRNVANAPRDYGAITASAAGKIESIAPQIPRCFALAVTAGTSAAPGQPTSWSAVVDALANGDAVVETDRKLVYLNDEGEQGPRRLFVISTGNVEELDLSIDHLAKSDQRPIEDPAQAWNALTIGAYTNKRTIASDEYRGHSALAEAGQLAPCSKTGVAFDRQWPIKPEVLFEGGNAQLTPEQTPIRGCDDLLLVSTGNMPHPLVSFGDTSGATAQAARLAARLMAKYPTLWPEAIRGLIVHSARWTQAMKRSGMPTAQNDRLVLTRRYGYGVADENRAMFSAKDALTLIAQRKLVPARKKGAKEIHMFSLPWPKQALLDLGEALVTLRVTLSYFIQPNPARRGWKAKFRYASHGLRFELIRANESEAQFRKRVNAAIDDDEAPLSDLEESTVPNGDAWFLEHRTV